MKLQDQVCTLEQATNLAVLGVKQKSVFYYAINPYNQELKEVKMRPDCRDIIYSAFTVSELGVMLPSIISSDFEKDNDRNLRGGRYDCTIELWKCDRNIQGFGIAYRKNNNPYIQIPKEDSLFFLHEAEARAEMLIYLIENKFITVEEVNEKLK